MRISTAITAVVITGAVAGGMRLAIAPPQIPTPLSQKQLPTPKTQPAPVPTPTPTPKTQPAPPQKLLPPSAFVVGLGIPTGLIIFLKSLEQ